MNILYWLAIAALVIAALVVGVIVAGLRRRPNNPDDWGGLIGIVMVVVIALALAALFAGSGLVVDWLYR